MPERIIPHSRPTIGLREVFSVIPEILSGRLAIGEKVSRIEQTIASMYKKQYAKATSSGTTAIQLALRAMNVGPGDEVIIPSYTCYSVMSAVMATGSTPVLADIDRTEPNVTGNTIAVKISARTRAVVVPHLFGNLADIESINDAGIPVIEDYAQALGAVATIKGKVAVFSFYPTKMIAGGRGGMILTDDDSLYAKVVDLTKYDGRDKAAECYNFSITNLEASIIQTQLTRLHAFVARRRMIADAYSNAFRHLGLPDNWQASRSGSIPYRYVLRLRDCHDLDTVARLLRQGGGVETKRPVFQPLHRYFDVDRSGFSNTETAHEKNLSLPIYPAMTRGEVRTVMRSVTRILEEYDVGS